MSESIYIIDWQTPKLPEPRSEGDLWKLIERQKEQPSDLNPRYIALARHIVAKFPGPEASKDSIWVASPLRQVANLKEAVWHLELPKRSRVEVTRELVAQGGALGLALYDDQLGLGFLPGDRILPESAREDWEALTNEIPRQKLTQQQVQKKIDGLFAGWLAPHGFVPVAPRYKGTVSCFQREDANGKQCVTAGVHSSGDDFYCLVSIDGHVNLLRDIQLNAIGPDKRIDPDMPASEYRLGLLSLEGAPGNNFFVDTEHQIRELHQFVESKAVPLLDRLLDLEVLNWAFNHVDAYKTIGRQMRRDRYASLICAHLFNDPVAIEQRAKEFADSAAAFAARNPNVFGHLPAELDRMKAYLRDSVKPLT